MSERQNSSANLLPTRSGASELPPRCQNLISSLRYGLGQLRPPLANQLGDIVALFDSLKHHEADLITLLDQSFDSSAVAALRSELIRFLGDFAKALQSTDNSTTLAIDTFQPADIQSICRGLAVCVPSAAPSLFGVSRQVSLSASVQTITHQLLNRALTLGLPDAVSTNDELLGILNWVSRGLKAGLLVNSAEITTLFRQSLVLMADWTSGNQAKSLLSNHNLGRCAVQIATLINHIPFDPQEKLSDSPTEQETWSDLLQRCVLNLCSPAVLDRLTDHSSDTIPLLNICNTVKDALDRGRLSSTNAGLQQSLTRLVHTISRLPYANLIGEDGKCRALSNFSNFLRTLCEYRVGNQPLFAQSLPCLTAACNHLIGCVDDPLFDEATPGSQQLSNLISFVKLCDKRLTETSKAVTTTTTTTNTTATTRTTTTTATTTTTTTPTDRTPTRASNRTPTASAVGAAQSELPGADPSLSRQILVRVAQRLVATLMGSSMSPAHTASALGGLIAGLAYLWQRNLVPRTPALQDYADQLVAQASGLPAQDWTDRSRRVLLPALLGMLKSAMTSEHELQPLLNHLVSPQSQGAPLTLFDLQQAMKGLNVVEEVIEPLPPQPIVEVAPREVLRPARRELADKERIIPGLTKPRQEPQAKPFELASLYDRSADSPGIPRMPVNDDWQAPRKIAKPVAFEPAEFQAFSIAEPVSEPVVVVRASPGKTNVTTTTAPSAPSAAKVQPPAAQKKSTAAAQPKAAAQNPAAQNPAAQKPVAQKPVAQKPVAQKPAAQKPVAKPVKGKQRAQGAGKSERGQTSTLPPALQKIVTAVVDGNARELATQLNAQTVWKARDVIECLKAVQQALVFYEANQTEALNTFLSSVWASLEGGERKELREYFYFNPPQSNALASPLLKLAICVDLRNIDPDDVKLQTLLFAAEQGLDRVVSDLVNTASKGPALTTGLRDRENALMLAAKNGHTAVVTALMKDEKTAAAQVSAKNQYGANALMIAAQMGHLAVVKELMTHEKTAGEQATATIPAGWSALMFAADPDGCNALMIAARKGHVSVVTELMKHEKTAGEQATAKNKEGCNALMIAAQHGHVAMVTALMSHEKTADKQATAKNQRGVNALMLASSKGYLEVVTALMKHEKTAGIQATAADKGGWNALMVASSYGHLAVVTALMMHENTAGEQATATTQRGSNALMVAASNRHVEVVTALMKHEETAGEQATAQNKDGWNALMLAARKGHVALVTELMAHKKTAIAQATATTQRGANALKIAAENGHLDVVTELMKHEETAEVQVTAQNKEGWSALMVAAQEGYLPVVKALLAHRKTAQVQLTATNNLGQTALALAGAAGHTDIVLLLWDTMASTADASD